MFSMGTRILMATSPDVCYRSIRGRGLAPMTSYPTLADNIICVYNPMFHSKLQTVMSNARLETHVP